MGIEWACVDDQTLLDELVGARTLMRNSHLSDFSVGIAAPFRLRQYLDILESIWAVNRTGPQMNPHCA